MFEKIDKTALLFFTSKVVIICVATLLTMYFIEAFDLDWFRFSGYSN